MEYFIHVLFWFILLVLIGISALIVWVCISFIPTPWNYVSLLFVIPLILGFRGWLDDIVR